MMVTPLFICWYCGMQEVLLIVLVVFAVLWRQEDS